MVRNWLIVCAVLLAVGCATFWAARMMFRSSPDFYRQAMQEGTEPERQRELAASLQEELRIAETDSEATWTALFSEEQINAWLATELPRQFPLLLPPDIHDPRVQLHEGWALVACRLVRRNAKLVLSLEVRATVAEEQPNAFSVEIHKARAGWLPVPRQKVVARLSEAAARGGLDVRWAEGCEVPTAIVRLPTEKPELRDDVLLRELQLHAGEISISGTVVPP